MTSIEVSGAGRGWLRHGAGRWAAGAAGLGCVVAALGCGSSSGGSAAPTPEAGVVGGPPGTIYVSMYGDDEITVIDQATHAILSHIALTKGAGPAVLVATPDNKKLYTANWSNNSISAVDLATKAVTEIPVGSRPWAISMSPAGDKLWSGLASNELVAIDTATDTITTTYDTSPNFPESVAVSSDGTQVYIDPGSTSDISGLSTGTFEALSAADGGVTQAPVTVGGTPAFASVSTDGTRAYTLNFLPGTVSVIDTVAWKTIATLDTGSGSQPIISSSTPDNLLVVTNFGTGNLMTFDFTTNTMVHELALDGRPVGVGGYNADGTLGYVVDFGHASLAVAESIGLSLQFLMGNLTAFVGDGPGHVTAFDPATGEKIGTSITVGKGPTGVVVVPR